MYIVSLKELKNYSFFELQEIFNIEEEILKELLKTLSFLNIVKRIYKENFELDNLLESDIILEYNTRIDGDIYSFNYVGMIMIENICLIIYPKYINNYIEDKYDNFKVLKQIIAVIRKYQSKEQKIGINDKQDSNNFNILSIALELIYSYHEYGLYSNYRQIVELNGTGEILWEKTINENMVYFSNKNPIYLDTFNINQESNEQDYFRRLHAFILTTVCNKIKSGLDILGIDNINISSEVKENFGNNEYILYRINQELSTQFVTYKQNILKLIKRYIEEKVCKSVSENISFVGTNNFNLVWEDVCSVVMNDCINKSIKELGLTYSKIDKKSALLSDVISKPKWQNEFGVVHTAVKTLVPDIVTINGKELSIYDAKYYKIKLDDKELKNQPGVSDITKQYLYELSYQEFAKENNLLIKRNAFLMPTDGKEEIKIGKVSMEIFNNLENVKLNDIEVILKPSEKMYEIYLEK